MTTTKMTKTTKTTKTTTRGTKKKASGPAKKLAPVVETLETLRRAYPDAHCELVHATAFQLLVATVLSAQSTDVGVNKATPALFTRYPDAASLARADVPTVERLIGTIGMFRQKAKRIVELAKILVAKHGGEVPNRLEALVELPGVGRKTANVVLGVWFDAPVGVVVDTHVQRITQRLGWTRQTTPEKIELDLMKKVPQKDWDRVAHILIFHGRRTCTARSPACERCPVNAVCPVAFRAEGVGRKPGRSARA
jgi:endonuclease-3